MADAADEGELAAEAAAEAEGRTEDEATLERLLLLVELLRPRWLLLRLVLSTRSAPV